LFWFVPKVALNVAAPICCCSERHCFSAAELADELLASAAVGNMSAPATTIHRILCIGSLLAIRFF
jgi:hypothetical protein